MTYETAVTTAKIGTVAGGSTTVVAGYFSNIPVAAYGIFATVFFGVMGLVVTYYFKNKEYRIKLAEFKAKHKGADPEDFLDSQQ
jgi:acyl-coenzyme A synthetase/AMP-(fatty) acid ligase